MRWHTLSSGPRADAQLAAISPRRASKMDSSRAALAASPLRSNRSTSPSRANSCCKRRKCSTTAFGEATGAPGSMAWTCTRPRTDCCSLSPNAKVYSRISAVPPRGGTCTSTSITRCSPQHKSPRRKDHVPLRVSSLGSWPYVSRSSTPPTGVNRNSVPVAMTPRKPDVATRTTFSMSRWPSMKKKSPCPASAIPVISLRS
mmetsp:Transcript_59680/g.182277  ORF Transcript_59680/g.182277 Transcript_59680/m.182277 type:complete len:201 (-) Transcript_59680:778-1380(-)